jgi:hypothetical protein
MKGQDILTTRNRFLNLLPAIARTPRKAIVSTALIAGIATAPLAATPAPAASALVGSPVVATAHTTHTTRAPAAQATQAAHEAPAQAAPATQAAPAQAPTQAGPSTQDLLPNGVPGDQSSLNLDDEQKANAAAIVKASQDMHLPPRAAVIAVATSMQETKLHNYGDLGSANDHDSLGLFQQRPTSGWGSPQQLTDPHYATTKFLTSLTEQPDWQHKPLTDAAQTVQVSAFGDRYAQWEKQAADLVQADWTR